MAKLAQVMPGMVERFARPMSVLAGAMLVWKMVRRSLRQQLSDLACSLFRHQVRRLLGIADPYLTVTVPEHDGEGMMKKSGDAYEQAKAYLSDRCALRARQLRAGSAPGGDRFVLSMGDGEEVADEFRGTKVWWYSLPAPLRRQDGGRAYRLVFHRRHRELVVGSYLPPSAARDAPSSSPTAAGSSSPTPANGGASGTILVRARRESTLELCRH
jgi:chaperone BCS1